jgi:hypothetical protein
MERRSVALSALLAGALGAALGLREVGALLAELEARAAAFGRGPIPHAIDWISQTASARRLLGALDGLLVLAVWLLAGLLAWRLLRLLNPSGTLLAPGVVPRGDLRERLSVPLVPSLVRRTLTAALLTAYLLGGVRALLQGDAPMRPTVASWGLSALALLWPDHPVAGLAIAFLLGGALLWLLWGRYLPEQSRSEAGGGAVTPGQELGSRRREIVARGLLARGLLMGAAAFPVLLPLTLWGRVVIGDVLDGVGVAGYQPWNACFWGLGLGLPAAFCALGCIGHVLAGGGGRRLPEQSQWEAGGGTGRRLAGFAFVFLLLLGGGEAYLYDAVAEGRYDYGRELIALVGGSPQPSAERAYLIFTPTPAPLPGFISSLTIEGIDAAPNSTERTWAYLRRRRFQSVAAGEASVHLHDCASLRWDSTESLRVDLATLEMNPRPIFATLLVEKLSTCAPSPENLELLRQAADAARFHQSPFWMETLGLLHHRFGDRAKAVSCLGSAGLSARQIARAVGTEAALTTGLIRGRILVNGHPGAGLTVGVLPADHWQTLVGRPRPFELRWVAAATAADARGNFRLGSLGEGDFFLIVMGDRRQLPLRRHPSSAEGNPGLLHLDSIHPARELGTLRIRTSPVPSGPPRSSETQTT